MENTAPLRAGGVSRGDTLAGPRFAPRLERVDRGNTATGAAAPYSSMSTGPKAGSDMPFSSTMLTYGAAPGP